MAIPQHSSTRPIGTVSLWAIRLLALLAASAAGYLSWTGWVDATALGCSGNGAIDCDKVLATAWSSWLGMPVSLLGALCYAGIFVATWFTSRRQVALARGGVFLLVLLTVAAAGSAIWFGGLQVVAVGKYCVYCLLVHACGLLIAAIVALNLVAACRRAQANNAHQVGHLRAALPLQSGSVAPVDVPVVTGMQQLALPAVLAVLGLVVLVGGQLLFPERSYEVARVDDLDDDFVLASSTSGDAKDTAEPEPYVAERPIDQEEGVVSASFDEPIEDDDETLEDEEKSANDAENDFELPALDDEPEVTSRVVEFLKGKVKLDLYEQAVLGSRQAPYVVLELLDYSCQHCRHMHHVMHQARQRYGEQVAIIVLPVPLELSCNKRLPKTIPNHRGACRLAKLALGVAEIDDQAYEPFHDWLMEDEEDTRAVDTALVKAYSMVERDELRKILGTGDIDRRIASHVELFAVLVSNWQGEKALGLPIQVLGDQVSGGKVDSVDELCEMWETHLGVRPVP